MEPVGDLYQDHAHVVRQGEQHLAEILRLLGGVGIEDARHLRQAVHHRSDLRTEDALHVLHRVLRVLHHVVKQRRHHRLDPQADFVDDDLRHGDRMQHVGLARTASHPLVRLLGQEERTLDEVPVLVVAADLGARQQQVVPVLLYDLLILGSIIHRL